MDIEAPAGTVIPIVPVAPTPPPGSHIIPNLQLEEIEKAIYSRDYEHAGQLLLMGLRKLKVGGGFIGYGPDPLVQASLYTRLAAAVVTLFADPGFTVTQQGFDHFASEHAVLDLVFRSSAFMNSDYMLPAISANPTENDRRKLQIPQGPQLIKFMLTYSLRSGFGMNFEETFSRAPQVTFSLWAGMISTLLTIAKNAQERREALLGMHEIFKDVEVPDAVLPTIADAYMYSSYGLRRDKHDMKGTVHRLFANTLHKREVKLPGEHVMRRRREGRPVGRAARPKILICVEWFSHLHAMFRCYAPIIRQLRSRFHLVGMCRAQDIDEEAKKEFDEWYEVSHERLIFGELVHKIVSEIRPDIIYYPSLGMAMWWVMLASVRLAPIQLMTLGHPSSSRSPCVDYVLCETDSIGDPSLFTERIVTFPAASARFEMRPDGEIPAPVVDDKPDVVRIAIPAMLCKLNATFMGVLRDIQTRTAAAGQKVEFHFFINQLGVNLYQATREIHDWLPGSPVYERLAYTPLLQRLSVCHLHLCTFPFGGTNSNIDSMLLGVPILAMDGDQPHERFDASMARRAGLGEAFIATSIEQYASRAVDLVTNHDERNAARDLLRATDLMGLFYGKPEHPDAFLHAMEEIYENHELMQASEARIFATSPATHLVVDGPDALVLATAIGVAA